MPWIDNISRKVVSFESHVAVYATLHISNFSAREIKETWYSPKEVIHQKRECLTTVQMIVQNSPLIQDNTDLYCTRGLEYRTPWGLSRRKANKYNAITAVLDEQDIQIEKNSYDPMALAIVYHQVSGPCQEMAHQLALQDERYVVQSMTKQQEQQEQKKKKVQSDCTITSKLTMMDITYGRKDVIGILQATTTTTTTDVVDTTNTVTTSRAA